MARSDLLLNLIRSKASGDEKLFQQTVEAIIAEERSKQHHTFANQIAELRDVVAHGDIKSSNVVAIPSKLHSLLHEIVPQKSFDDLILDDDIVAVCEEVIEEQHRLELLRSYNVEPRHRILLSGAPGNGKTSLAEAMAESLSVPLMTVRYDGLITSFLGETNQRLKQIFDYAKTHRCVLFFDEFDTVGKERGDEHETGEIKRVVSSLLLQIDSLPSHVVVVAASNHPELLDRAVGRRFQVKFNLHNPSSDQIKKILAINETKTGIKFPVSKTSIMKALKGASFSDVENFCLNVFRRYVLEQPGAKIDIIVKRQIAGLAHSKTKKRKHALR